MDDIFSRISLPWEEYQRYRDCTILVSGVLFSCQIHTQQTILRYHTCGSRSVDDEDRYILHILKFLVVRVMRDVNPSKTPFQRRERFLVDFCILDACCLETPLLIRR